MEDGPPVDGSSIFGDRQDTMRAPVSRWVRQHDPELNALHKAVKVAFAVTAGLAIGTLIGNGALSLFAAFGSVALLLFADFPGSRSARLGGYLLLVPIGAVLITLGTLASTTPWLAVGGMVIIGFVVLFVGVLSAATAAASRAALLAYILPVMVVGDASDILPRLAGWVIAALLAVPLAVFVWPPKDHDLLRARAADACRALGLELSAKTGPADEQDRADQASGEAITALRRQFRSTEFRPVGLTSGSRLLVQLVDRLEWLKSVVKRIPAGVSDHWPAWNHDMVLACAAVLRAAGDVMPSEGKRPSFANRQRLADAMRELERFRRMAVDSLELIPEIPHPGDPDTRTGVDPDPSDALRPALVHELGYTTHLAGQVVANSAAADARPLMDRLLGRQIPDTVARPLSAAHHIAVGAISRRSVWFQNSIRGALGLAFAVLLAELTEVQHGFWVVLGTMSVLRSSALNTGSTALRAVGGTIAGFVIGAVLMLVVGTNPVALWILLPIAVFVAGFVPAAVSFAAGQAAFTVLVVILFNIIDPIGWTIGLLRIEDVLIGAAAGLVTGILLWPRGAAAQIRAALADSYRTSSAALSAAVNKTTSVPTTAIDDAVQQGQSGARAAAGRLDDAFRQYQSERGSKSIPVGDLTIAVNAASRMRLAAEAVATMTPSRPADLDVTPAIDPHAAPGSVQAACTELSTAAAATQGWFSQTADSLIAQNAATAQPAVPNAENRVLASLREDPAVLGNRPALAWARTMWWSALYVDDVIRMEPRLITAVNAIVEKRPRRNKEAGDAELTGSETVSDQGLVAGPLPSVSDPPAATSSPAAPSSAGASSPDASGASPAGASPAGASPSGASPPGASPAGASPSGSSSSGASPAGASPSGGSPSGGSPSGSSPSSSSTTSP